MSIYLESYKIIVTFSKLKGSKKK